MPGAAMETLRATPTTAILDAHWNFGQVAATQAATMAAAMAKNAGLACVVLRRCRHVGRLGAYTELLAGQDCLALAACSSAGEGHWVAPFGGREGRMGTNPISFAAPTTARPVVMDFATSAAAEGKIRLLLESARQLPEAWIVDAAGQPSLDPAALYAPDGGRAGAILPFGGTQGYKGFSLSLLAQIVCGLLGNPAWMLEGIESHANTTWLLAIDIARFVDPAVFRAELARMLDYIRSSPAAAGSQGVLVPGQREFEMMDERRANGIPVDDRVWARLVETARGVGVTVRDAG